MSPTIYHGRHYCISRGYTLCDNIHSWYKRSEFGLRIAIFFSAATVSGAFGGLLAVYRLLVRIAERLTIYARLQSRTWTVWVEKQLGLGSSVRLALFALVRC